MEKFSQIATLPLIFNFWEILFHELQEGRKKEYKPIKEKAKIKMKINGKTVKNDKV
jgi:hypothetical protein